MKKTILAAFAGLAFLAAPALQACDMEKTDTKVMKQIKTEKVAKVTKSGKAQKTAQKKSQTSKI